MKAKPNLNFDKLKAVKATLDQPNHGLTKYSITETFIIPLRFELASFHCRNVLVLLINDNFVIGFQ